MANPLTFARRIRALYHEQEVEMRPWLAVPGVWVWISGNGPDRRNAWQTTFSSAQTTCASPGCFGSGSGNSIRQARCRNSDVMHGLFTLR
jgi:hypothetical protein